MGNRNKFLTHLKNRFGDCSRHSFLQKLRVFLGKKNTSSEIENCDALDKQPYIPEQIVNIIDISSTDAWRNHVNSIKDVWELSEFLSKSKNLLKRADMAPFADSVKKSISEIPIYADKHFKEPKDIDDETSVKVAEETGKLVKKCVWDLLRGCHSGIKHSQETEKKFYESFYDCLEGYLSRIGVYQKKITEGMDVGANAKWFETPFIIETSDADSMGRIAEIEVSPHFIPYRDDGGQDELILKGVCFAFGEKKP